MNKKTFIALFWLLGAGLSLGVYLNGIKALWPYNPMLEEDAGKSYDQLLYMSSAKAQAVGTPGLLPRSRMPLYPWIMHFFCDPAKPDKEMVPVYMRLNIFISVLCLGAIFFMIRRTFGAWAACLITLITAFRFFIFKAGLAQPEILFYTLYFGLFLLMLRCLKRPSAVLYAITGLLAGITHLTKGSALPMIGIFTALALLKCALDWWNSRGQPERLPASILLRPVLFLAAFFFVTGIYLYHSWREYGSPFYDPNTRYYFWAESPQEMGAMQKTGLSRARPRLGPLTIKDESVQKFLPKWAPDETFREEIIRRTSSGDVMLEGRYDILPGYRHWRATHSFTDALARIWGGLYRNNEAAIGGRTQAATGFFHPGNMSVIGRNMSHPNGYWPYFALFFLGAVITATLASVFSGKAFFLVLVRNWIPVAFVLAALTVPMITFGWWAQVSNRNRFFLTLFLPFIYSFGSLCQLACAHIPPRVRLNCCGRRYALDACTVCLVILTAYCAFDLRDPLNRKNIHYSKALGRLIAQ